MVKRMSSKLLLFVILVGTMTLFFHHHIYAESRIDRESDQPVYLEGNYSTVLEDYREIPDGKNTITVTPDQFNDGLERINKADSMDYHMDVVKVEKGDRLTFPVNVTEDGVYHIEIDYFVIGESYIQPNFTLKINGQFPYYEARQLTFPLRWMPVTEDFARDRYNNELIPRSKKIDGWQQHKLMDSNYLHSEPLQFVLEKGDNTITIEIQSGRLYIGEIRFIPPQEIQYYQDYINQYEDKEKVKTRISIPVEFIHEKNDPSIRLYSDSDPSNSRYHTRYRLLNAIESESWNKGGQSVTWFVDVEKEGLYKIAFKYQQYTLNNLPTYRQILIDGQIPFKELENYPFHYTKKWKNEILHGEDGDYLFYFSKGTHTITLVTSVAPYRPIIETIDSIMDEINDLALEIKKLTGNNVNRYQNWKLTEYIPDVTDRLLRWANQLDELYRYGNTLNDNKKKPAELINLVIARDQLRDLVEDPNQIPNRLSELSEGQSSVAQLLGDLMLRLLNQPLGLEMAYIFYGVKLPKPRANFFVRLWESIKRFFLSFRSKEYSASSGSRKELEVWVNRPRQYVELMQKMIDEEFTPQTGVPVKLSIMPDENKLVLASAARTQPDIAMGVNHWLPYELAIRGAVVDLRQFEGYEELVSHFAKGAIIPYVFEDGVYAIPETQDFWVLMVRSDIFGALNLQIPDTWDDVVDLLPELQRRGMNFYEPIALYEGMKPFVATLPFIYQFGGNLYREDGMGTALDQEENVAAMTFMTDLFKIYNVPKSVPNFYNHFRYGTLPIGIANTATYIQLQVAAPEIKGNWMIAPHPGIEGENGEIKRYAPVGGQSIMIFEGTKSKEDSFKFISWWMSTDVQTTFARDLQMMFGESYLWVSANRDSFRQLPLPEDDKQVILEQWEWAIEASRVPGAYMIEREISNTWSKVVYNGANVRTTIDDAVKISNREILRKMEEFGYVKKGKVVKPYTVPTIYNIDRWLTEKRREIDDE